MMFKGYVIPLDFLIKSVNKDKLEDWYFSKQEFYENEGIIPYEEIDLYGVTLEFEDGHIMTFDNLIEN